MVILHIASIKDDPFNGVCVAAPMHVSSQGRITTVGLLNIRNIRISGVEHQLEYTEPFSLDTLPEPWSTPDLVVFHEAYRVQYLKISKQLRRRKIPYVIIPHGELREEAQKKKHLKKVAANILLFNKFINNSAAIQCLSPLELEKTHFGKRKFIGTNGIAIPSSYKTEFCTDGIRIIYIGRLEVHVKGLDLLLSAVAMAREAFAAAGAKLDIYGPDYAGRYAEVEGLIESNGVGDIVTLHHEISGEEKKSALMSSDLFIQTSRHEGMPMGILEALGYGLPCIVTDGTTLGERVEQNRVGYRCQCTPESIANALKLALSESESYPSIGAKAREYVTEGFSWDVISSETIKVYEELISK